MIPYWDWGQSRGLRWSHGELVNWRKEKRRKRKLLLLNKKWRGMTPAAQKQLTLVSGVVNDYSAALGEIVMPALANCPTSINDGDETAQEQAARMALEAAEKELAKFGKLSEELEQLVVKLDDELWEWSIAINNKEAPQFAASILAHRRRLMEGVVGNIKWVLKNLSNSR